MTTWLEDLRFSTQVAASSVLPQLVRPPFAEHARQHLRTNKIFTAKYNVFTFLPKFLFEQFMRLANFYFLVISIIQMSSIQLAPTGQYYTFIPLMGILGLTALKELYEDYRRHKQDAETNANVVDVLDGDVFTQRLWRDVHVGDIVRVASENNFPADLFLIASSEPEAVCYIETSNLDGETNLKIKQGIPQLAKLQHVSKIAELKGKLECEGPNNRLYNFEGTLHLSDDTTVPIGPNQILLRGSMLRNTQWVYGLVIYTGHDSKLLMNASATPIKKSRLERMVNKQIMAIFGLLFTMAIICVIGYAVWNKDVASRWYLDLETTNSLQNFTQFVVFVILFNTIVPISLYVTVEFVKFIQAIYINLDVDMYDPESDSRAIARTSNLNEELGQIEFVFSDKTGTLTRNQMQFRKCSIAGVKYGLGYTDSYRAQAARENISLPPEPKVENADMFWNFYDPSLLHNLTHRHRTDSIIREFLTVLAVCHTVIPENDKVNKTRIIYQASSPDEAALVSAAKNFGFYFNARKPNAIKIQIINEINTFELLNVLEFSSNRKRMSVIVRTPQGKIKLFCKGADSVILERLSKTQQPFLADTTTHLDEFAHEGLRTLVLAIRELDEDTYRVWNEKYHAASTTLTNRTEEIEKACDLIEVDMFLLGATAIEDKLQDGVPDAIQALLTANIRVWMLTGDKKETAVNIAYCCQLITDEMIMLVCDEESDTAVAKWTQTQIEKYRGQNANLALVIDGKTLTHALDSPTTKKLVLELAVMCKSCVCCRVSPIQKAMMVALVRENLKCVTLAIGDGANDVSMIQTADVGVGITGLEGLQAARSADYTIAQFRFLTKLLFVHGAWSYRRLSKVILFSFYKTLTLYLVSFYFSFLNGFSGQVPWDKLSNALWNVIFTLLPPVCLGIFDQDLPKEMLMKFPQLYQSGQRNDFFNLRVFFGWFFSSIWHSILVFVMVEIALYNSALILPGGYTSWLWLNGTVLYACILLTISGKFAFTISYWPWPVHLCLWGSLGLYLVELSITGYKFITFYPDAQALYTVFPELFSTGFFYFTILLVPVMCMFRDFSFKALKRDFLPEDWHVIQEYWRLIGRFVTSDADNDELTMLLSPVPSSTSARYELIKAKSTHRDSPREADIEAGRKINNVPAPRLDRSTQGRSGYAFSQGERDRTSATILSQDVMNNYDTDLVKPDGN